MDTRRNGFEYEITAVQARAARGLLTWSQDDLAHASNVPKRTIARLELGEGLPRHRTVTAIRTALEVAGVEFIKKNGGGPGVRLKDRGA